MTKTTGKYLVLGALAILGFIMLYPGFRSNLQPEEIQVSNEKKSGRGIASTPAQALTLQQLMEEEEDKSCVLRWEGENPLAFDHQGKFTFSSDLDLKDMKVSLIGVKNDNWKGKLREIPWNNELREFPLEYSKSNQRGTYKRRLRVLDAAGNVQCLSNVLTLTLKALPGCELKASKKIYKKNESVYLCFFDPDIGIGVYDVEFYGSVKWAGKSKESDDISSALRSKKLEDRKFINEKIVDLDELPNSLKDGRDKMCWKFPAFKAAGKFKRFVYGVDGSDEENRICKSNTIEFQVADK